VPAEPLEWLCTDDLAAYERLAGQCDTGLPADELSFYSARSNMVALLYGPRGVGGGAGTGAFPVQAETWRLSHEVAHQLNFSTGLQARGVLYPFWVSEGLAMCFETPAVGEGGFAADNPARRDRLGRAHREGRLRPMAEFVLLTAPPAGDEARLDAYAEAWGMVQFLFRRDPRQFRRYLCALSLRPRGPRPAAALAAEFEADFGPTAALQAQWELHLASPGEPASAAAGSSPG
jgi:hypothetical protein